MKKTLTFLFLLITGVAGAQSVGKTLQTKKDSMQNATINAAVSNPVGTIETVSGWFHHKPKIAAATTAAPAAATNNATTAPAAIANTSAVTTTTLVSAPVNNNAGLIKGNSKTINNGLSFSIIQCTGDRAAQTITITFMIANPSKANQQVVVGALNKYAYNNFGSAIDANGNSLAVATVSLGASTAQFVVSELPTGIAMKGQITLNNALSTSASLQYIKIPVASQNMNGAGDKQSAFVEERNIPVAWLN